MGLRADVIHELQALDTSKKAMRKFGLTVGAVFAGMASIALWRHWPQGMTGVLGALAAYLLGCGIVRPAALRGFHHAWMTFALSLGWCMSRLILTLVFVLAFIPIGLLGRVLRLPFIHIRRTPPRASYWQPAPTRSPRHHEDMF